MIINNLGVVARFMSTFDFVEHERVILLDFTILKAGSEESFSIMGYLCPNGDKAFLDFDEDGWKGLLCQRLEATVATAQNASEDDVFSVDSILIWVHSKDASGLFIGVAEPDGLFIKVSAIGGGQDLALGWADLIGDEKSSIKNIDDLVDIIKALPRDRFEEVELPDDLPDEGCHVTEI